MGRRMDDVVVKRDSLQIFFDGSHIGNRTFDNQNIGEMHNWVVKFVSLMRYSKSRVYLPN